MAKLVTGLDAGDYTIKVAVAEISKERPYPRLISVIKKESRGFRRGFVIDPEEAADSVAEALGAAEKSVGARLRRVFLGLDGVGIQSEVQDASVVVSRADSEITDYDTKRVLEAAESHIQDLANRRIIDVVPLSFTLDGKRVVGTPKGMRGAKLEARALFITGIAQHLDELVGVVEKCGASVDEYLPSPIAASLVTLGKKQKIVGCALVDIGAETTKVAVFEEGTLHSVATFEVGSQDITNDIALGLKVGIEEAEDIKQNRVSHVFAQKKLDEIIGARLSDIFECVEKHLKKLGKNDLLPAGIILAGGGAYIPKVDALAEHFLNLPTRIATPLYPQSLRMNESEIKEKDRFFVKDPALAVAYGLTVFGANPRREESTFGMTTLDRPFAGKALRFLKNFLP